MTRYPIGTDRRWKRFPWVTSLLVLGSLLIYLAWKFSPAASRVLDPMALDLPGWTSVTLVTYVFLHASVLHIVLNVALLLMVGGDVEDACGPWIYLPVYLVSGAAAGLTFIFLSAPVAAGAEVGIRMIGASGAVSGVMGVHLVTAPKARLRILAWSTFVPVAVLTVVWVVYNALMATVFDPGGERGTAFFAHLGGFAFGLAAGAILRITGLAKPEAERRKR